MIGCGAVTDIIECTQIVNNIFVMKSISLISLLVVAILIIYYSKTKQYKKLKDKYNSYNLMLKVPIAFSYIAVFTIIIGGASLMSVNVDYETFSQYINVFIVVGVVWTIIMSIYLGTEWLINKIGFSSGASFIKALRKK